MLATWLLTVSSATPIARATDLRGLRRDQGHDGGVADGEAGRQAPAAARRPYGKQPQREAEPAASQGEREGVRVSGAREH
jgi:hypothetical protein